MGSGKERTPGKEMAGGPSKAADCGAGLAMQQLVERVIPHSHADKLGGTSGEQNIPATQGSSTGK